MPYRPTHEPEQCNEGKTQKRTPTQKIAARPQQEASSIEKGMKKRKKFLPKGKKK